MSHNSQTSDLIGLFAPPNSAAIPSIEELESGEKEGPIEPFEPSGRHAALRGDAQNPEKKYEYDSMDEAEADIDAPDGSLSHMMGLFASTKDASSSVQSNPTIPKPWMFRQSTNPHSNLSDPPMDHHSEAMPLLGYMETRKEGYVINSLERTPKTVVRSRKQFSDTGGNGALRPSHVRLPSLAMPPIDESSSQATAEIPAKSFLSNWRGKLLSSFQEISKPTTIIGSFMYILYHVVFCLALGSAIIRPHSSKPLLGLMTKTAAIGTISSAAVYWLTLSSEIPALYPTVDLFLAPFLANLAAQVDEILSNDSSISEDENDAIFMATFTLLAGIGISFSGILLGLSGVFKLADLGSFLPFPVICGFFSAVGILTWTLAVSVDTGGKTVGYIATSGDPALLKFAIIHHFPSVAIAAIMKYLGPKNPFFVIMVVFGAIGLFYTIMFASGISLDEAKQMGWFWSRSELVNDSNAAIGFAEWAPPAPFGAMNQLLRGVVHWEAVCEGLSTAIALGFLYVIRCSVHGAALKKNIPNLSRTVLQTKQQAGISKSPMILKKPVSIRSRKFSEFVDIESIMQAPTNSRDERRGMAMVVQAKPTNISLKAILPSYGLSQLVAAIVGGFAVTPSVAASSTMFSVGAEGLAPQIGSVLLLFGFYITDFQLVGYIPKPAFSSMLVLAFIDMIYTWFYKSYFKTKDLSEWLVVPAIVLCAFIFDLLSAVFLGIALSTFLFVGSFFRSGTVKFVANGSVIHSTIERSLKRSQWLDNNGDFIQILVLQNYLFFGNASTVYGYILTMFERNKEDLAETELLIRRPKFLVMDVTLVTGIDTSTVDIFNEIRNLCSSNQCKLFVTGTSSILRGILAVGGFKPEETPRSKRKLRFFATLDSALGKAEDLLLESEYDQRDKDRRARPSIESESGFCIALSYIEEQHGDNFSADLVDFQDYTRLLTLCPGDRLYGESSSPDYDRGLFFIEEGIMKIEHDSGCTLTRGTMTASHLNGSGPPAPRSDSLVGLQAMEYNNILQVSQTDSTTFRLARIGPGWIAGTVEAVSGTKRPGEHIAVTHCRLHHLSFSKIAEVEEKNPLLVLKLYKLLAYMMARRQEATITQLATIHSIMTSPASSQKFNWMN